MEAPGQLPSLPIPKSGPAFGYRPATFLNLTSHLRVRVVDSSSIFTSANLFRSISSPVFESPNATSHRMRIGQLFATRTIYNTYT